MSAAHPMIEALRADDRAHAAAVRDLSAVLASAPPDVVANHGHLCDAAPYALTYEVRGWVDRVRSALAA